MKSSCACELRDSPAQRPELASGPMPDRRLTGTKASRLSTEGASIPTAGWCATPSRTMTVCLNEKPARSAEASTSTSSRKSSIPVISARSNASICRIYGARVVDSGDRVADATRTIDDQPRTQAQHHLRAGIYVSHRASTAREASSQATAGEAGHQCRASFLRPRETDEEVVAATDQSPTDQRLPNHSGNAREHRDDLSSDLRPRPRRTHTRTRKATAPRSNCSKTTQAARRPPAQVGTAPPGC